MNGSQLRMLVVSPSGGMRSRNRFMRASSRTPKTARRITSSVIACIRGRSSKTLPRGQVETSRAAASAITRA